MTKPSIRKGERGEPLWTHAVSGKGWRTGNGTEEMGCTVSTTNDLSDKIYGCEGDNK